MTSVSSVLTKKIFDGDLVEIIQAGSLREL